MTFVAYKEYKRKILGLIQRRTGWKYSTSKTIAADIVDHIKYTSGGGMLWATKFDHGKYNTSHMNTLDDFVTALKNISIPTQIYSKWQNRHEFKELQAKFQTTNAIEALNAFIEKPPHGTYKNLKQVFVGGVKTLAKIPGQALTIIKNDSKSLFSKTKANYLDWKASKAITLAELRATINFHRSPQVFIKTFLGLFGVLNSVIVDNEVTVGVLPLGGMGIDSPTSVTMIDVAHSNKIVKYRAVGSIYLAHQIGGHDSIRITGKLQGPIRLWFLTAIWILTILSQGYWQEIDWESDLVKTMGTNIATGGLRAGIGGFLPTQKVDNIITQKPAYRKHITYPVITEHEIIPNCYIETFSFEEKLESGKDIITYDLLMRTYVEPKEFLTDSKRSVMRVAKEETKTEELLKYGLNFAYRLVQMGKEALFHIDSNSWKVNNYYELDAIDVGTVMFLSMAGVLPA
jgi:hypothetical protein